MNKLILFEEKKANTNNRYYYSKPYFTGFASWYNASKSNKKLLAEYESIMEEILFLGRRLEKQGLPVGAYLQAEVYRNYLQNYSTNMFDNHLHSKYVKHLVRALSWFSRCLFAFSPRKL